MDSDKETRGGWCVAIVTVLGILAAAAVTDCQCQREQPPPLQTEPDRPAPTFKATGQHTGYGAKKFLTGFRDGWRAGTAK